MQKPVRHGKDEHDADDSASVICGENLCVSRLFILPCVGRMCVYMRKKNVNEYVSSVDMSVFKDLHKGPLTHIACGDGQLYWETVHNGYQRRKEQRNYVC